MSWRRKKKNTFILDIAVRAPTRHFLSKSDKGDELSIWRTVQMWVRQLAKKYFCFFIHFIWKKKEKIVTYCLHRLVIKWLTASITVVITKITPVIIHHLCSQTILVWFPFTKVRVKKCKRFLLDRMTGRRSIWCVRLQHYFILHFLS